MVGAAGAGELTVRLTLEDPPEPALGVALTVPAYVPAEVTERTVTLLHVLFAAQLEGPVTVVPPGPE